MGARAVGGGREVPSGDALYTTLHKGVSRSWCASTGRPTPLLPSLPCPGRALRMRHRGLDTLMGINRAGMLQEEEGAAHP